MSEKCRHCEVDCAKGKAKDVEGMKNIKVFVGYGWQKFYGDESQRKGKDVLYDTFWKSIQGIFKKTCDGFNVSKDGHEISVSLRRLRASHGRFVWPTIEKRIAEADALIFDVAAAPSKDISGKSGDLNKFVSQLNANVLLEIGYALGCGKRVFLMCPKHLFSKVPSDLSGFLWTLYTGSIKEGQLERSLVDHSGTINAFRGMLREIASSIDGNERED
jgi:hypothetical protein